MEARCMRHHYICLENGGLLKADEKTSKNAHAPELGEVW